MTVDEIEMRLQKLQDDPTMITQGAYSPNIEQYPDGKMPFKDVHLAYLRKNKHVNPLGYISNLELMIKRR